MGRKCAMSFWLKNCPSLEITASMKSLILAVWLPFQIAKSKCWNVATWKPGVNMARVMQCISSDFRLRISMFYCFSSSKIFEKILKPRKKPCLSLLYKPKVLHSIVKLISFLFQLWTLHWNRMSHGLAYFYYVFLLLLNCHTKQPWKIDNVGFIQYWIDSDLKYSFL